MQTLARCTRNNAARDLDALAYERTPLLRAITPYGFTIPVANPAGIGVAERRQEMLLPHELFATLFAQKPAFFHRTFATAALPEFWGRQDQARLARHPAVAGLVPGALSRMVPVQLYGDNVSVATTLT